MGSKNKTDYPIYLFNEGSNSESYKLMLPRYVAVDGKKRWRFRCWAPRAQKVSVVGDFNDWDPEENIMHPLGGGIWEAHISGMKRYDIYKFCIVGCDGVARMKADPFCAFTETPPATASKVCDINMYSWGDKKYVEKRATTNIYESPINIYEVHLGSWKNNDHGNPMTYLELAEKLVPYVKDMGYTHIEFMPLTEHPLAGSWGYQVGFMYAPTSRFGTPYDLMHLIDVCHQNGIGVIMDFVLSHFPKDAFGLYEYDGAPLYEYENPKKQEHKTWGTRVYDYGKGSVRSFLTSAVCYWLEYYHIDGVRLDAVASMLYLDYDRKAGEWEPNVFGGNYNLEAIDFLKKLNETVLTKYPYAMMIAEESTSFPMVTMPPSEGGLGFNFKWNMGWMNDVLAYEKIDPFFRKGSHNKLTFSLTYAYTENFILPFSHDEVVHGKASMIGKMQGSYEQRFRALKALYAFQMMHPGKKLNFMGNEFAQFIEWNYAKELDWLLLDYPSHMGVKNFIKDLNHIYLQNSEMYELDSTYDGFKWLVVDDAIQNVVAFYRKNRAGDIMVAVISFSDVTREGYRLGVPEAGEYIVVMDSNSKDYDGHCGKKSNVISTEIPMHGQEQSIEVDLEGNTALLLKIVKEDIIC